ncbi:MAG TPA: NAD(+)/NADH kinase, partial [Thermoanaerobaculia bacterium]|nr:NAD(+)/NADH kinase [Thermoanaerobaculia bacterium]
MKGSRASASRFRRVGIVAKMGSASAADLAASLEKALRRRGRRVVLDAETAAQLGRPGGEPRARIARETDLVLVLGGDGTLLSVARSAPSGTPLLGVNLGTLGFLSGLPRRELIRRLGDVLSGKFREDRRRRMDVTIVRGPHHGTYRVLNDAVLNREAL